MSSPEFDAPTPEALSALLPAYEFEVLIAKSGSGAVYKGRQKSLDREVAIKILPQERVADPVSRKAFETEARALAKLNHPNLIAIFDSGEVNGMFYLVMEFVPGKSLYRSAYGRKIDPTQAVELVIGICKGLAHAHENGLIHRAVSPANILLNRKAEPKIGDFGMAHRSELEDPGYTAPEVLRLPEVADRRSDLYAAGVILYELLTGTRQKPDSPVLSVASGVDISLDRIWQRATNPNPGLRYADGNAFATDLSEWLKRAYAIASHSGTTGRLGTGPMPHKAAPPLRRHAERIEEAPTVKPSGNFASTALNLFLFAVLAGGGYLAWKKFSDKPPEGLGASDAAPQTQGTLGSSLNPSSREASAVTGNDSGRQGSSNGSRGDMASQYGSAPPGELPPLGAGSKGAIQSDTQRLASASDPLTQKARELVAASEEGRRKKLAENVNSFRWNLNSWLRTLAKGEQANWQPYLGQLYASVRDSRVPTLSGDDAAKLPPQLTRIVNQSVEKQRKIDAEFTTEMARYRDLYISKMKDVAGATESAGKDSTAETELIRIANDLDTWVFGLGGQLQPNNPAAQGRPATDGDLPVQQDNPFGRLIGE